MTRSLLLLLLLAGGLLPLLPGRTGFLLTVTAEGFLFVTLASSWDLTGGRTGYPSFGNMTFFGVGAYTTAILMNRGIGFFPALAWSGGAALFCALVIGFPLLRLRGPYFTVSTLGLLLATREIAANLTITGGGSGLTTPLYRGSVEAEVSFYYLFFSLAVLTVLASAFLRSNRFGLLLSAIRDDEEKALTMGINSTAVKVAVWALGGLFTGLAGGTYAYFNLFIDPGVVFNLDWSVLMVLMALLGGAGTVSGPVLGALLLHGLNVTLWSYLPGWQYVVLGALIVVVVLFFPGGIVGSLSAHAISLTPRAPAAR